MVEFKNEYEYEVCGLLWNKQTDGPGLCYEDQYEALQFSRKNCRLPQKQW